ncbi:STAS domain-containing protein [Ramlibacter henchirensis]|uniref:STAS domain-containing protein n=1 Tax=Ramlibacter henchirensis TaxID=204072 RepID=A0A4Z0C6R9_9BURK|nr:STAS domain-containing protein [Ramlibacter henchirensis]TFZ07323.1 STAS domain-containing protein [Ramlibacter henchirensis]
MLVLPERLTHADAPACVRMLAQALRSEGQQHAIADAGALRDFDSSALAVLLDCRREALSLGKNFSVANMPPRLRELASVYGVGELLTPVPG